MATRCHAFDCDDPTGGPEPTANLDGYPAHPDCAAALDDEPTDHSGTWDGFTVTSDADPGL